MRDAVYASALGAKVGSRHVRCRPQARALSTMFLMALFALRRRMRYTWFRFALTMGSKTMDRARFRDWVSSIDELTAARCPGASRTVCAAIAASPAAGLSAPSPARAAPQGAVAVLRRVACRGRDHPRCYGTLRDCAEHGVPPPHSASSRERQPLCRRAGAQGRAHPDGQQPPQPDQGLPATLPRHRHQASRQLSEVVPSRRPRQASIAKSMPRGGQRQDKPAIRELSLPH